MLLKQLAPWVIGYAVVCAAYFIGYQKGVAVATQKSLGDEISSLNKSLDDLAQQTHEANKINLQLSKTISDRKKSDAESTKVFANALAATAHFRFDCVFDDNVMQQLHQAAERADQAASSGFGSPLRAGDSSTQ